MLQLCSTRDPSLGECNVEVSLCICLSRGKWFGSDSNDQINYPTSQASTTRWAVDDESSGITHRSRNRSGCSLIPLYRNESLSEWLMMSFGKYKRNTYQIQKQPRTLTRRRTIGFLISHILMILFYYLVYIQFMQNFLDDERGWYYTY